MMDLPPASQAAATAAPAATTAPASSTESPSPTASVGRLGPTIAGRGDDWTPAAGDEAWRSIEEVAAYCETYCPARLVCVENDCRLYRLEGRALKALGYERDEAAESVGVQSQPIVGL